MTYSICSSILYEYIIYTAVLTTPALWLCCKDPKLSYELMATISKPLSSKLCEIIKFIECCLNCFIFFILWLLPEANLSSNFQLDETIIHDQINYLGNLPYTWFIIHLTTMAGSLFKYHRFFLAFLAG